MTRKQKEAVEQARMELLHASREIETAQHRCERAGGLLVRAGLSNLAVNNDEECMDEDESCLPTTDGASDLCASAHASVEEINERLAGLLYPNEMK